ncbi:MAG: DNA cytosine methyltransferase [Prevotellaceae bacterium]|jgi:DNA (cytosine-5)-methyltransferase 1|nr:DNA cytosine methyltransferase [Prevotellaceae bacterium]
MIGVDIFSGVGGMSLGASMAGVNVKFAVEKDKYAADTFLANHRGVVMFNEDIQNLHEIPIKTSKDTTILFGGPPCQGFSYSNQRTRNKNNAKNWLFKEFARITKLWNPDWFVLENVSGILHTEKGFFLEQILDNFHKEGYTLNYKLCNATDFGVPQKRVRFFLVGSKHGIKFQFPEVTESNIITVKDAISDLPSLCNGADFYSLEYKTKPNSVYAKQLRGNSKTSLCNYVTRNSNLVVERYKHIPQGGNWENIPNNLMSNYKDHSRCHDGIYLRLKEDKPSSVIGNYRKNMLIHPTEDRGLSVREAARLQSFPDNFVFVGSVGFQQQQVGNAVPPLLSKAIFSQICSYQ